MDFFRLDPEDGGGMFHRNVKTPLPRVHDVPCQQNTIRYLVFTFLSMSGSQKMTAELLCFTVSVLPESLLSS